MTKTLSIQFRGDVDESNVLQTLYAKQSGFKASAPGTRQSADVAYAVVGVVLAAAQLITALWQIHIAERVLPVRVSDSTRPRA